MALFVALLVEVRRCFVEVMMFGRRTRAADTHPPAGEGAPRRRRWWWRTSIITLLIVAALLVSARAALPSALRWYVNRTIDQSALYDGTVGEIDVHLWRGAYSIADIKLNKTTGNVPVPLFSAERVDLAVQWNALRHGRLVGRVIMQRPQINFVDGEHASEDQTGLGGPWLKIVGDLFPLKINSAVINEGAIHFRAFQTDPPVDIYISRVELVIENLTNIDDDLTTLIASVDATGLAMDHAPVEYHMRFDPFSYRPTFQLALKLNNLNVVDTNDLTRAYAGFDFEHGWFDLVIELDSHEGAVEGYVKPLYRDVAVLSLNHDVKEDNVFVVLWEAMIGLTAEALENQPRNQFATRIPLRGDLTSPNPNLLATLGGILRNAFIRAYLPQLEGPALESEGLEYEPAPIIEPET